jgi:hypothetical protein
MSLKSSPRRGMDGVTPVDAVSCTAYLPELHAHAEHTFAQGSAADAPENWRETVAAYEQLVAHNSTQGRMGLSRG